MNALGKPGLEKTTIGLRMKLLAASAAMLIAVSGALPASASEYLLGPQDKVRLKIYEWRASRDSIFEWTALNDQFTVGADGYLSLPFIGSINAQGTDPAALGRSIGRLLMESMGLGRAPNVAVEVVQFRPFYIVGQVKASGEYPYRPGLTVLQALSIAGGLQTREERTDRLEREVISGRGDLNLLALAGTNLLARKARLQAELAGSDDVVFPDALTRRTNDSSVALAMQQEKLVFTARKDGMKTQLQALNGLKDFLLKEQSSLEAQLALYDEQIELVKKELTGVSTLVDKGLSAAPREIALERALAQVRSDRLAAETAVFRARQEISRTDISILDVSNRHTTEVSESLRETQAQMNEVSRKADTAMQMLRDSEITAPRLLALRTKAEEAEPIYVLLRTTADGKTEQIPATETTTIAPGDTVKVKIPLPTLDDGGLAIISEGAEPDMPLASDPGPVGPEMTATSSTQ